MVNLDSTMRGLRAMKKNRSVNWGVEFGKFGFFLELWTPTWHDGRGPYLSLGLGLMKICRGY